MFFSSTFVCSFVFVFPNVTASAAGCSAEFSGGEMQRWVCEGQPSAQAWDRITPLALMLITLPLVLYFTLILNSHHPTSRSCPSPSLPPVFYSHHPGSCTCIIVITLAHSSLVMVSPQPKLGLTSPFLYSPSSRALYFFSVSLKFKKKWVAMLNV